MQKTIIVTGGNDGIGKAIAADLAAREYRVVIISRNAQKGQQAVKDITEATGQTIDLVIGDLGTISSTKQVASDLLHKYEKINVLINNAGLWPTKRRQNEDGLEMGFMVNHMAPFILSNLLLGRLQNSLPARIVNVNAGLYVRGQLNLTQTPYGHDFSWINTYANTKLCNILFTMEFARRIEKTGVTINAVHPGVIRTKLGESKGLLSVLMRLIKRGWDEPEKGAEPPVWLAISPDVEGVNGRYFDLKTETAVNELANDKALAQQLWTVSTNLAQINATAYL
ncbi:MAG: SDR family oxidoreductase [Anaerolineales bacterium]|nr:SDR family oxidoreductase [Anaerolineales bacterium]